MKCLHSFMSNCFLKYGNAFIAQRHRTVNLLTNWELWFHPSANDIFFFSTNFYCLLSLLLKLPTQLSQLHILLISAKLVVDVTKPVSQNYSNAGLNVTKMNFIPILFTTFSLFLGLAQCAVVPNVGPKLGPIQQHEHISPSTLTTTFSTTLRDLVRLTDSVADYESIKPSSEKIKKAIIDDSDRLVSSGSSEKQVTISDEPTIEQGLIKMTLAVIVKNTAVDNVVIAAVIGCLSTDSNTDKENWGISDVTLIPPIMTRLELWAVVQKDVSQDFARTTDIYIREGNLTSCLLQNVAVFSNNSSAFSARTVQATESAELEGGSSIEGWIVAIAIAGVAVIAIISLFITNLWLNQDESEDDDESNENKYIIDERHGSVADKPIDGSELAGRQYFVPVSVGRPSDL